MRRRGTKLALVAAAAVSLPLAVAVALIAADDSDAGACTPEEPPPVRANVVAAGPEPIPWGVYVRELDQKRLLHNQAHGGVVVQYGPRVPGSAIGRAEAWYHSDPVGLVVAPLAELDATLRVSAWGSALRCRGFDVKAFDRFRDTHRFRGPERIPPLQLRPVPVVRVAPQPVRTRATISFAIPPPGRVEVVIRDSAGTAVRRLGSFSGRSGQRLALRWDGRDRRGRRLEPGRYAVVLLSPRRGEISTPFHVD